MFDERRNRNPGIDKSYLLEPIAIESSKSMSNGKRQVIGPAKQSIRGDQKIGNYSKKNLVPPLQNRYINNQDINGNSYYNTAGGNADADSKPKQRTNVSSTSTSVTKVKKPLHALSQSSPPTSTSLKNVTNQNQKVSEGVNKKIRIFCHFLRVENFIMKASEISIFLVTFFESQLAF